MKDKGVQGIQEVQGVKGVKGVQDITLDDIIGAAHELRDEENAQISAEDLDLLIGIAPNTEPIATRHAEIGQQSANHQHTSVHGSAKRPLWWAVAACLLGFLAGFGVKSALPSSNSLAVVPSTESTLSAVPSSPPDTILLREVVHDTVYQTRVIVCDAEPKAIKTVVAQNEQKPEPVETTPSVGCSMLCDDIPYAYLAHN